jgi:hypothetical protein
MVDRQGSKTKMANTANRIHYHDYRHKRINGTVPFIQIIQFRYYTYAQLLSERNGFNAL